MRATTVEALPSLTPLRGSSTKAFTPHSNSRARFPEINDLSAFRLKTLNKAIKTNDVSSILKDSNSTLLRQKDSSSVINNDLKEVSNQLLLLRKRYNELRENCLKKEHETFKMRSEIDKLKTKENLIAETATNTHSNLEQLKEALEIQQIKVEEALEMKRVYLHMYDRLKKDKIADQIKATYLQEHLARENRDLYVERQNVVKAADFEQQAKTVFNGVVQQMEYEDKQRQECLNVFEKTLEAQEEADLKRSERINKNHQIFEAASNDLKDSNENRWRELQLVHRFLNFFLKLKIEREIRQYGRIETTYQKIKAATGLVNMKEIVTRFVGREQTYSELLISIADYEKKIAQVRKTNEQLKSNVQALKDQNVHPERQKEDKTISKSLADAYKNLSNAGEVCQKSRLVVEKSHSWALQTLIKIDKAKKIINRNYYEEFPKNNMAAALCRVIQTIKTDLESINDQNVEKVLDDIDNTKIDAEMKNKEFMSKIVRVKPIDVERTRTAETPQQNSKRSAHHTEDLDFADGVKDEPKLDDHEHLDAHKSHLKHKHLEPEITKHKKGMERKA